MSLDAVVTNPWGLGGVIVVAGSQMFLTWKSMANAKAANKAVNGNPEGQPRAYDMLEIIQDKIDSVESKIDNVNVKLDSHLSWHQTERQEKPKCASVCKKASTPVKSVAKKAPVKKSAPRSVP